MTVRLRPRADCCQMLHRFNLGFNTSPSGKTDLVDLDGNSTSYIWFDEPCSDFCITATSCVETLRENPFDYILGDPGFFELPAHSSNHQVSLTPFLHRDDPSSEVDLFANGIASEVNHDTVSFLGVLCSRIHEITERIHRTEGHPFSPEEVLVNKKGACRDVTVLFMDACRSLGLPARFTSGYFYGDEEFSNRQLHAWAEVYLPGGGWRGFDPTIGLAVSNQHVAIASGPTSLSTAPSSGSFRGTGAESSLEFNIQMTLVNSLDELTHHKLFEKNEIR